MNDMSIELLDELIAEMKDAEVSQYKNPQMVAVKEETQVSPVGEGVEDAMKEASGIDPEAEKKTYLNPGRQNVMEEIEDQSADALDWGGFVKGKRA